jgi:hypothetical protein
LWRGVTPGTVEWATQLGLARRLYARIGWSLPTASFGPAGHCSCQASQGGRLAQGGRRAEHTSVSQPAACTPLAQPPPAAGRPSQAGCDGPGAWPAWGREPGRGQARGGGGAGAARAGGPRAGRGPSSPDIVRRQLMLCGGRPLHKAAGVCWPAHVGAAGASAKRLNVLRTEQDGSCVAAVVVERVAGGTAA